MKFFMIKKNILIFSMHFYPENFRINSISKNLSNIYENIFVITGHPNYPAGKFYEGYKGNRIIYEKIGKLNIYRVPMFPRGSKTKYDLFLNYTSFLISSFFLSPFILFKKKIDSIFVFGTSPLLQGIAIIHLKFLKKAKLNLWVQDLWPDDLINTGYFKENSKLFITINKFFIKILYTFSDRIFIQSKSFQKEIENYTKNKNQFFFLPNPTEKSQKYNTIFENIPFKLRKFYDGSFNLLFAGNIGNNQSIDTIIYAAKRLQAYKKIRILIVGDGSRYSYLKKKIRSLGIKNIFALGRFPLKYMRYFYFLSDACYVSLASIGSLPLTIPAKIQEYMFAERPIIASLNGEGAKLIETIRCGYVSNSEDPIRLSYNIIRLYNLNDKARNDMSRRGFIYAKNNFDINLITKKIVQNLL